MVAGNLKFEDVDVQTAFKILKSRKVGYENFSAPQIYEMRRTFGFLFDDEFNAQPKQFAEDSKVLSQSQIQNFLKCERYWYFKSYKKLIPEYADDTWLRFGRAVHLILSKFYDNIDMDMARQDPVAHFTYVLKLLTTQHWDWSLDEKYLKEHAIPIFDDFAYYFGTKFTELDAIGNIDVFFPESTEEDIYATSFPLRSIIDRINHGYKTFADYKTNKRFPDILLRDVSTLKLDEVDMYNYTSQNYVIQSVINAICIHDKYKIWPEACIFMFLRHLKAPHHGLIRIDITQDVIDQVVNYINQIYDTMRSGVFKKTEDRERCTDFGGCEYSFSCDALDLCIHSI